MSDKPIRILDILPALNVDSGVASYEMNYLRGLDHSRYIVDIVVMNYRESPYNDEIESFGGKIYVLPSVFKVKEHIKACKNIFSEMQYDIVHNNTLSKSLIVFYCAKKAKVPVRILHSHSSMLGDTKKKQMANRIAVELLLQSANQLVACSKEAAKCYFGDRNYTYIPNVIDSAKYKFDQNKRTHIREKYNLGNKKVICTVARLSSEKNPMFAFDVIEKLLKRKENVVYWWIGSGALEKQAKEYVQQIGIEKNVMFFGKRADVADLYQAMDVFLLTSFFEGMPLTCIEAQAMGLPCVVSSSVTDEVDFSGGVHFVSLEAGPERWAEEIEKCMESIENREDYHAKFESSMFTGNMAGHRLMDYYNSVLCREE